MKHKRLLKRDGGRCFYCGAVFDSANPVMGPCIDHLTPKQLGGCQCLPNLVIACRTCNSRKHDRTLEEYREYVAHRISGYGIARDLLIEALNNCSTPYDAHLTEAMIWLNSKIPRVVFSGEEHLRLEEPHRTSCSRSDFALIEEVNREKSGTAFVHEAQA